MSWLGHLPWKVVTILGVVCIQVTKHNYPASKPDHLNSLSPWTWTWTDLNSEHSSILDYQSGWHTTVRMSTIYWCALVSWAAWIVDYLSKCGLICQSPTRVVLMVRGGVLKYINCVSYVCSIIDPFIQKLSI